jgi:hypothetical protein
MPKVVQLAEAFWKYVTPADGCWNWRASVGNHGYGQLTYLQQKYTAHRLSWELHRGPIPDDLCVLHHCDNRRCVNPDHLFLGTRTENLEDMTAKGRRVRGEKHGRAKLTEAEVIEIRASKDPQRVIAARYGVTPGAIALIQSRRHWRHLS